MLQGNDVVDYIPIGRQVPHTILKYSLKVPMSEFNREMNVESTSY